MERPIQAKLEINQPGDLYEQEADRVADQVIAMPVPENHQPIGRQYQEQEEDKIGQKSLAASITPLVQRQEAPEEREREGEEDDQIVAVQAKPLHQAAKSELDEDLENRLYRSEGGGSPIADEVRTFFEPRMQFDFSEVRIHKDNEAAQLNQELGARAFTHERDIYLGANQYTPDTIEGKRLLAHELTHVVQQGRVQRSSISQSKGSSLVQRQLETAAALKAGEWIALGAAGYMVAQDAVKAAAGDVSYTVDEMEGVLLPGGGNDVSSYRTAHPNANIRRHTHTVSTWLPHWSGARAMGIKFGITFNYDGHAIGNISCNILDTYDWPTWEGSVNVNFTPLSLARGDVAAVRITLNLNADRTLLGGMVRSRILELDGSGRIRKTGRGAHVRFGE